MTQKDKELLLKDLCSRLPYGVKGLHRGEKRELLVMDSFGSYQVNEYDAWFDLNSVIFKPYLFPLSSITEGQKNQISQLLLDAKIEYPPYEEDYGNLLVSSVKQANALINYCLASHLDINGLIEKGLAVDATGLNVY